MRAPWQVRVATQLPGVQRILGHAIGIGALPEHVRPEPQERPQRLRRPTGVFAAIGFAAAGVAVGWMALKACSRVAARS
jgi:hypothetical protein